MKAAIRFTLFVLCLGVASCEWLTTHVCLGQKIWKTQGTVYNGDCMPFQNLNNTWTTTTCSADLAKVNMCSDPLCVNCVNYATLGLNSCGGTQIATCSPDAPALPTSALVVAQFFGPDCTGDLITRRRLAHLKVLLSCATMAWQRLDSILETIVPAATQYFLRPP